MLGPMLLSEEELASTAMKELAGSGLPQLPPDIEARFTDPRREEASGLNTILKQLLLSQELSQDIRTSEREIKSAGGYSLRLHREIEEGETVRLTFFLVESAWLPVTLGLIGLTIGIATAGVGLGVLFATGGIGFNLARNVVVLKKDNDATAIAAYEAYLKARTDQRIEHPTTAQVGEVLAGAPENTALNGLLSLKDRGLLKIKQWGGSAEDWQHPDNSWDLAL
jgi:hypothetical protein